MSDNALAHIEEAYKLLTGECYRGSSPDTMQFVDGICTIVMDLERVDGALGQRGASMFASIAETIQAVYTEIKAARRELEKQ